MADQAATGPSEVSDSSQTAEEFISSQLQLEADAREALPYQFDSCTRPLGALRQLLFSCLSCNPPPANASDPYTAAGVCYSCSISCHGEHTLVELFNKRDFVCDCGTTRLPDSAPCTLRVDAKTGRKGGVTGEEAVEGNKYNQNFGNRFCGCEEAYDPHTEKGTMFQCLGLGTVEGGGCGEDWWHPECIVGLRRGWYEKENGQNGDAKISDATEHQREAAVDNDQSVEGASADTAEPAESGGAADGDDEIEHDHNEPPLPPGFPHEDDFEYIICYKCVEANPWIKRYAGAEGFLPAVFYKPTSTAEVPTSSQPSPFQTEADSGSKKRKADDDAEDEEAGTNRLMKRQRADEVKPESTTLIPPSTTSTCKYSALPPAPTGKLTLFLKPDFRDHICHCATCFPYLTPHPQLREEEETYEPPLSDSDAGSVAGHSGNGSLLEMGEAALGNVDRVRAIEGVMVYNHLKDKVKDFLKPFAESGKPVGAQDIKAYFEKLRGDAEGIAQAGGSAGGNGGSGGGEGDGRREQSGC